jgi:hypothetical protein
VRLLLQQRLSALRLQPLRPPAIAAVPGTLAAAAPAPFRSWAAAAGAHLPGALAGPGRCKAKAQGVVGEPPLQALQAADQHLSDGPVVSRQLPQSQALALLLLALLLLRGQASCLSLLLLLLHLLAQAKQVAIRVQVSAPALGRLWRR